MRRYKDISMPSIENTLIPEEKDVWDIEFKNVPSLDEGDYRTIGSANEYDRVSSYYGICAKTKDLCNLKSILLLSGYYRRYVTTVTRRFRPKKGTGITSWISYGEYSSDDRFESYWEVRFEDQPLWYELDEFLSSIVVTQDNLIGRIRRLEEKNY
jgi:hypothetical protein